MNSDLFVQLTLGVIIIVGALMTYVLMPYLKAHTNLLENTVLRHIIEIGVFAAEQVFLNSGEGPSKKRYVLDFLKSKGVNLSEEQMGHIVEAVVFEMNRKGRAENSNQMQ